jgi:hypothetical protein
MQKRASLFCMSAHVRRGTATKQLIFQLYEQIPMANIPDFFFPRVSLDLHQVQALSFVPKLAGINIQPRLGTLVMADPVPAPRFEEVDFEDFTGMNISVSSPVRDDPF